MPRIDLNCDLGEGAGHDEELMPLITSANIACGAHAGDEATMRATVALAEKYGVAIGAHPGLRDREHFGRREIPITSAVAYDLVLTQTRLLQAMARVWHVKPHGALYNMAARDEVLARAIAEAVRAADPQLILVGLAGSRLIEAGRACGLVVANEVFADRTYQADGSLTPRSQPGALITEPAVAVAHVCRMIGEGRVLASNGTEVNVVADTVCLHGDGSDPVGWARQVRQGLRQAGVEIGAFGAR